GQIDQRRVGAAGDVYAHAGEREARRERGAVVVAAAEQEDRNAGLLDLAQSRVAALHPIVAVVVAGWPAAERKRDRRRRLAVAGPARRQREVERETQAEVGAAVGQVALRDIEAAAGNLDDSER